MAMGEGGVGITELKLLLGLSDAHEGSRAVGHSGPENDEWEDYIEVPVSTLAVIADLMAATETLARIYSPLSCSMRIGSERREAWNALFNARTSLLAARGRS